MTQPKKQVHMICQAHLDPVWLWPWEDGLTETLSTFRIACDFCDQVKGFVFCHNEAILYQWVEEHDPALLKRIQKLVKAGRWHIAGGSWLQPDLNVPSGESHIRQFLFGKTYFQRVFGIEPTTAYNMDPFGQPEGYAQILAGCGFDSYIFCRPNPAQWELPTSSFRWRDRSGSEVIARRSDDHYLTQHNAYAKFKQALTNYKDEPQTMVLWGIGNHGGGPSREDLQEIKRFSKDHPQYEMIHSTPEAFFAPVAKQRETLPVIVGELQNCFRGCYTSMHRIKQAHRACESLMASTERMATMAWWQGKDEYPQADLEDAWKDILFGEFHDILPGSGTAEVEQDAHARFGHCVELLRRLRVKAFLRLLQDEKKALGETTPIFVWNPHSFPIQTDFECEFTFSNAMAKYGEAQIDLHDGHTGKNIPLQREQTVSPFPLDFRVKVVVPMLLEPFQMRRLDATWTKRKKPVIWKAPRVPKEHLTFKGKVLRAKINTRTGLLDFLAPAGGRKSFLKPGALRLGAWADLDHAWDCGDPVTAKNKEAFNQGKTYWRKSRGTFRLATKTEAAEILSPPYLSPERTKGMSPVRIIEQGPVRTIVEAVFIMGRSAVVRRYILSVTQGWLEVHDRIFWNERDTMLKLEMPLAYDAAATVSEMPYSAVTREVSSVRAEHVDHVNQRWVAVTEAGDEGRYVAILNDGLHGHSIAKNTLYTSVLRSPVYASPGINAKLDTECVRHWPRQDQGEHEARYRIVVGQEFNEKSVSREAQAMNIPPAWLIHHPTSSKASKPAKPFIRVSPASVSVAAVKKTETGRGLVVRLWNQSSKKVTATVTLGDVAGTTKITIGPQALKTLVLQRQGSQLKVQETNLIEAPVD